MIGVIQHEGEWPHLIVASAAIITLDFTHEGRHRLAVSATGQVPIKQAISTGVAAGTESFGIKIDFPIACAHTFDAGHGIAASEHRRDDRRYLFL